MIEVTAPASKSFSHRYLIAAALASGTSTIHNVLDSNDTTCTREILSLAGARFTPLAGGSWQVQGTMGKLLGGKTEPLSCYVHESGTTCRLLTAVLASGKGNFRIHGAPRMHERPMGFLVNALRALGCDIVCEEREGFAPLQIRTRGIRANNLPAQEHVGMHALAVSMDESSQYFSGLLLASPQAEEMITLVLGGSHVVSWPYIGLTLQCMHDFGVKFLVETREHVDDDWLAADWRTLSHVEPMCLRVKVQPGPYRAGDFYVEGDWSGASYLVAAGALGTAPCSTSSRPWEPSSRARTMPSPSRRHPCTALMWTCPSARISYPQLPYWQPLPMAQRASPMWHTCASRKRTASRPLPMH